MYNYLILMGRGIEGTGNTKYAVELQKFLRKNGDICDTIANSDKKWGREKSHINDIKQYKFSRDYNECRGRGMLADTILVLSVPARNYTKESKDNFHNLILELHDAGKKIVYFQVDHSIYSINRNYYKDTEYEGFFKCLDLVITHSNSGDFLKKYKDKLNKYITTSNRLNGINGINFDEYIKYWKPFKNKLNKSIKFIGRAANWKGPYLFRDLHEKYFKRLGFICSCEGMEMSIGSLGTLLESWTPVRIPRKDNTLWFDKEHVKQLKEGTEVYERNHNMYMMPPYNNAEALERLSKCQFGIELLLLKDEILADVIEYVMLEMIAVGVIPIFRKKWGQSFKINGKPLIDYGEETGTIFLDEESPTEAIRQIVELSQDEIKYEKYRLNCFKFYKTYLDNDIIYKNIKEIIDEN